MFRPGLDQVRPQALEGLGAEPGGRRLPVQPAKGAQGVPVVAQLAAGAAALGDPLAYGAVVDVAAGLGAVGA